VLDAESMPYIDVTAVHALERMAMGLQSAGIEVFVARDIGSVRDVLREAGAGRALTAVYPSVQLAVEAAQRELAAKRPESKSS
jgi:SulP family sulfate permease